MITMKLADAAEAMGGQLVHADLNTEFCGVSTDSRKIEPGMLFVPIAGARVDGHQFADQVMKNGASVMLWQKDHLPVPEGIPAIVVDDTILAMGHLAKAWLAKVNPYTIGITGSNGKTSTKDFGAALFSSLAKTYKTQGNHNNEIGLPLTVFEMDDDTKVLILEMGMENRGEIAYLCSIAPLNLALITSIGSAHMENLGSKTNIARAKCEITTSLKPGGSLIYHNDGEEIRQALSELSLDPSWTLIPYGENTEYNPENLHVTRRGLSFELKALDSRPFQIPSANTVQAYNATGALLAAKAGGVPEANWHEALANASLTPMRGDLKAWKNSCILDDTYKSNPEAARSAISTLMEIPADVHIAVLSDMLDLGPEEKAIHAAIGQYAHDAGVDVLFTWGPLSKETSAAFEGTKQHFETKEDLLAALKPYALDNTAILVKGSRAMAMDTIVKGCLEGESNE